MLAIASNNPPGVFIGDSGVPNSLASGIAPGVMAPTKKGKNMKKIIKLIKIKFFPDIFKT